MAVDSLAVAVKITDLATVQPLLKALGRWASEVDGIAMLSDAEQELLDAVCALAENPAEAGD